MTSLHLTRDDVRALVATEDRLVLFVPGALRNPLNGSFSRAHWRVRSRWANGWKAKTRGVLLMAAPRGHTSTLLTGALASPKRIAFLAQTGATWDDDAIPAGLKPIRDALIGLVIHSDAPTSGHEFVYAQVINRTMRGVRITITPRPGAP